MYPAVQDHVDNLMLIYKASDCSIKNLTYIGILVMLPAQLCSYERCTVTAMLSRVS